MAADALIDKTKLAALDCQLEEWARWVHRGGFDLRQSSMLARLIENKGLILFDGNGGSMPMDISSMEANIEAALMRLSSKSPDDVVSLRFEYGAIRIDKKHAGEFTTQRKRALAMGVSLRTYQVRISRAKSFLITELGI
jgi:hypothetical protein